MTNFGATQVDESGKQMNFDNEAHVAKSPFRMESIDRVSKLPVVEEIMKLATNMYGKFRVSVYNVNTGKASVAKVKLLYGIGISLTFTFICEYIPTGFSQTIFSESPRILLGSSSG
jgi:hypothetical protein